MDAMCDDRPAAQLLSNTMLNYIDTLEVAAWGEGDVTEAVINATAARKKFREAVDDV
jgi:hypothetical protein